MAHSIRAGLPQCTILRGTASTYRQLVRSFSHSTIRVIIDNLCRNVDRTLDFAVVRVAAQEARTAAIGARPRNLLLRLRDLTTLRTRHEESICGVCVSIRLAVPRTLGREWHGDRIRPRTAIPHDQGPAAGGAQARCEYRDQ